MTSRARLPDRRPNVTRTVAWGGRGFDLTVGFDPGTGMPREVFASGPREGSDLLATLADACVIVSVALQHGVAPGALHHSLLRVPLWADGRNDADGPASPIGAIVGVLVEEAAQMTAEGA